MRYAIPAKKIQDIATFSPQYIQFARQGLTERMEEFLSRHARVLRCYVSFRPEYRRDVLREGMRSFPGVASRLRVGLLGFADSDICAGKNLFRAGHKKSATSFFCWEIYTLTSS